jgi:hypothetical protein
MAELILHLVDNATLLIAIITSGFVNYRLNKTTHSIVTTNRTHLLAQIEEMKLQLMNLEGIIARIDIDMRTHIDDARKRQ